MDINLKIGTFDWNWFPHLWVYRPTKDSKGTFGFAWLFLLLRIDFSSELASRSYIEKGIFGDDGVKHPTFEIDWKKH